MTNSLFTNPILMKLAFDEREEEVGDSGAENEGQNANLRRSGLGKNGGSYHTKLI